MRAICSITRAPILIKRPRSVANSQRASGFVCGIAERTQCISQNAAVWSASTHEFEPKARWHPPMCYSATMPTEIEDEQTWIRHRVVRLRTILRFVKDPRAETALRDLIAEAEARLEALEARRRLSAASAPPPARGNGSPYRFGG
jgi:hypothetical protein